MNNLIEYIILLKEKTKYFNELEKIRYVYIDIGSKMTFDLKFAFGNENTKEKIYRSCLYNLEKLNKCYESKTIICKSLAYLLEYVLKSLGINITTLINDYEINGYNHVYNIIRLNDDIISIDLQKDLENIQAHLKTKYFGLSTNQKGIVIDSNTLKEIDLKIGYITEDKYYSDEYYYLMRGILDSIPDLNDKISFILNNVDPYDDYLYMKYAEFRWHFINNMYLYLKEKEKRKVGIFDMYYEINNDRKYILGIIVNVNNYDKKIYLYNEENNKFENLSIAEFNDKIKNGLLSIRELPKKIIKKIL
ncbi:MAG: hypothetical protein E7163_05745 [Firmicutes bacterium]|nr:hypothetical protein [Bacillota bacterium]